MRRRAILLSSVCESGARSVPFGKYSRKCRLVFSFEPALPGALWIAEIDGDVGFHGEAAMTVTVFEWVFDQLFQVWRIQENANVRP